MATNKETTVKISKWIVEEIDKYIKKSKKNMSEFPSKRNFVDMSVMKLLEERGVNLDKK